MATRDLIGKRGEAIVTARLMDFCGNPDPYFDVHPLGEKCPTFDYLVELESDAAVRKLRPDHRELAALPVRGVIVTAASDTAGIDFVSRFFPCRRKNCHLSIPAGMATSKNPTIISSEVWSPQVTVFSGSGLWGLFFELSYHAIARSFVPAFKTRGSASL